MWSLESNQPVKFLKCGILKKSFTYYECTSCQLPISRHHFWVGATANPPKSDDWKWATDKRCIHNKLLLMKSTLQCLSYKVFGLSKKLYSTSSIKSCKHCEKKGTLIIMEFTATNFGNTAFMSLSNNLAKRGQSRFLYTFLGQLLDKKMTFFVKCFSKLSFFDKFWIPISNLQKSESGHQKLYHGENF